MHPFIVTPYIFGAIQGQSVLSQLFIYRQLRKRLIFQKIIDKSNTVFKWPALLEIPLLVRKKSKKPLFLEQSLNKYHLKEEHAGCGWRWTTWIYLN